MNKKLAEAMQDLVARDESISFDKDEFERSWLKKLLKEGDPKNAELIEMLKERIEKREMKN